MVWFENQSVGLYEIDGVLFVWLSTKLVASL